GTIISDVIMRYTNPFVSPEHSSYNTNDWSNNSNTSDSYRSTLANITYDTTTSSRKYTDAPLATQQLLLQGLIDLSWIDTSSLTDGYVSVRNSGHRYFWRGGFYGPSAVYNAASVYSNAFTYACLFN